MSASSLPRCSNCGNTSGPWKPSGEVLPSGEQLFVCQDGCPVVSPELTAAVAEHGPFPMPVGTPDSLTEILARADAATPGPWCTDEWEIYQGTEYLPGLSWWIGETCRGTSTPEQDRADATFVAAARTDVPELVAEVVRLRARVAELLGQRDDLLAEGSEPDVDGAGRTYEEYYPQPAATCAFKNPHEAHTNEPGRVDEWQCPGVPKRPAEDPHDSPLRHRYDTPRDLPEVPW